MRCVDISFNNILLDEKSYKKYGNILIYGISYKTFMDAKPLLIRFDKIDDFIKIYDGIRYLVLRDYERYNAIYDRIKYFVSEKSGIINSINHNFERIRIDSSVVTKNKNYYYYNIFFKKVSIENPIYGIFK